MLGFNYKFILTDLGFDNFSDLYTSIIGFKGNIMAPISFLFAGGLSMFITNNVWENPNEVYFLAILIGIDFFTGVWKAIKFRKDDKKKFQSRKITRTVGKIVTYSLLIYISFNLDKNQHAIFFWMPYSILAVFYATEAWSIIENLSDIGHINKHLVTFLKKKLSINNILKRFSDN